MCDNANDSRCQPYERFAVSDNPLCLCSSGAVAGASAGPSGSATSLAQLPTGTSGFVAAIRPSAEPSEQHLNLRLMELGFVDGEPVRVIAHGHPGREPIAVRIGGTTFALRRFEADRILVTPNRP